MAFNNRRDSGSIASHTVMGETPSGTINGSNTVFTTASTVLSSLIDVFLNGVLMKAGGTDYTFSGGNTITFVVAPPTDSILLVDYIK